MSRVVPADLLESEVEVARAHALVVTESAQTYDHSGKTMRLWTPAERRAIDVETRDRAERYVRWRADAWEAGEVSSL